MMRKKAISMIILANNYWYHDSVMTMSLTPPTITVTWKEKLTGYWMGVVMMISLTKIVENSNTEVHKNVDNSHYNLLKIKSQHLFYVTYLAIYIQDRYLSTSKIHI